MQDVQNELKTDSEVPIIAKKDKEVPKLDEEKLILQMKEALEQDNIDLAKKLIEKMGDAINFQNQNVDAPIFYAIENDKIEIVELLLEKGADPNIFHKNAYNPLIYVAGYKKLAYDEEEIAKLLLKHGADVNATTPEYKSTALMWAVRDKNKDIFVKFLLDNGADVNIQNKGGYTALMYAVMEKDKSPEIVKLLLDNGADVNAQDKTGTSTLMFSLLDSSPNPEIVKLLLDNGADVNTKDKNGDTILINAIESSMDKHNMWIPNEMENNLDLKIENGDIDLEIIKYLLEHGADVNARDEYGSTALICAVLAYTQEEDYNNVEFLLKQLDVKNKNIDLKIMKLFLEHGADVNVQDNNGQTALMYAVERNDPRITKFLLDNGAKLDIKNKDGKTAFDLATDPEVKKLLEKNRIN